MIDEKALTEALEPQVQETQPEQPTEVKPETEVAQPAPQQQDTKHFRVMREKQKTLERERDEALRRIQEMESRMPQQSTQVDDDLAFEPDALIEGKHISKVTSKIKKLEQQLQQYEQRSATMTAEIRLKSQYPDFDNVVSEDNLELLNISHPEIAQTIRNSNSDLYGKAVTAYTMIKKLGIAPEENTNLEKRRILENQSKPKAVGAVSSGGSPLSHAMGFDGTITDSEKKILYQQMLESKKRL